VLPKKEKKTINNIIVKKEIIKPISSNVRNKTMVPSLCTHIQHSVGIASRAIEEIKKSLN
jgi:hypothetical protein